MIYMYSTIPLNFSSIIIIVFYLPSISASLGGYMPEKFIWNIGIPLHSLPRITLFPAAFHKYYRSTSSGQQYNLTTWWFWILNLAAYIVQVVQNGALLTLTFISSSDNFGKLKRPKIVSPSFKQINILSLDTVRVIISRQNLARVFSRFLTLYFPPK